MVEIEVNIKGKNKSYPIYVLNDELSNLTKTVLDFTNNKNYIAIFSEKVYKLYGKILNFPKGNIFILKDGEEQKNLKNYQKIMDFVLRKKLTREDYIIAIGGGVVGDIAGFVSSTYMRGINFIQIPTTLLACTDSAVGGKTAVNSKYGKNLIGAFYQPKVVFINVNFLKTLDERQFKSGLGEVVKYGFIEKSCLPDKDFNLINFLNENFEKILAKNSITLIELIEICIKLKISVVQNDEKEAGLRKILNLGHTYAHAIESLTKYKKYNHGECVAKGLFVAFGIALKLNKITKEYYFLFSDLMNKFQFKQIPNYDKLKVLNSMLSDKKSNGNEISLILPNNYGEVEIVQFTPEEILQIL